MKYIFILFLIYLVLKSFAYADYEMTEKKNKSGGITLKIITCLGLILPMFILLFML